MKKKLLSVILAGFMVMGCLAGCTSNDQTVENEKNTSETEQAESGEKTVITVARWPDGGIVVLDNTTIYDMAMKILEEENA